MCFVFKRLHTIFEILFLKTLRHLSGVVLSTYLSVVSGVGCSCSVPDPCSLIWEVSKRHIEGGLVLT